MELSKPNPNPKPWSLVLPWSIFLPLETLSFGEKWHPRAEFPTSENLVLLGTVLGQTPTRPLTLANPYQALNPSTTPTNP